MGSVIGGKKQVKIFILYLMENINYPLDFSTLSDIMMQTDYVAYLDFAECFHEMLDGELLHAVPAAEEGGEELYEVTEKGRMVAKELSGSVVSSLLEESLSCAYRYLDFSRRGVRVRTAMERTPDGHYEVSFFLTEKEKELFSLKLRVDREEQGERMRDRFREKPEVVFRGVNALLTGNVDFLFDR